MKKMHILRFFLLMPFLLVVPGLDAQEDSVVTKEIVKLRYFNDNNTIQYLLLENSSRTGKKTAPLKDNVFQLYLDSISPANLIGEVKTDQNGKAKAILPPSLKIVWEGSSAHKFIALPAGDKEITELEIVKARMLIDTASSEEGRSVMVQVQKKEGAEWLPAGEVEMRIGVLRQGGGILSANEDATFTTDSSGIIKADFKRDSLPGDPSGNIVLVAKVDDNDLYGNLEVEKAVPWGVALKSDDNFFNQRSLWATRIRTPFWLLFMAYSIIIGVWGTIFYLVWQIVKIKRLGGKVKA